MYLNSELWIRIRKSPKILSDSDLGIRIRNGTSTLKNHRKMRNLITTGMLIVYEHKSRFSLNRTGTGKR
jgi:hypothetical protein